METKKELMTGIFGKIPNREQCIINQLNDENPHLIKIMMDLSKNIDLIMKTKGPLKKQKIEKKTIKNLKKGANEVFYSVRPSKETFVFHLLLDCLTRLSYMVGKRSKIIDVTAERLEKSPEEVEEIFSTTNVETLNIELSDRIYNKLTPIDTRISNFVNTLVGYNDTIINNKLLQDQLESSKSYVNITSEYDLRHLYREYEFLKEIMKSCIIGTTSVTDLDLEYTDKEKKELKYNFTRVKNFVIEIEKEIKLQDKLYKCGKYKELVLRSFIDAGEEITYNGVDSYLEYLIWIDGLGRLEEEYQLLDGRK